MAANLRLLAYQFIRRKLLYGELRCGDSISPPVIAAEMNISHTPVREAINLLESEGLLEHGLRTGHHVRQIEFRQLEEMFDIRLLLESGAAELAAARGVETELDEIHRSALVYRDLVLEARRSGLRQFRGSLIDQIDYYDIRLHLLIMRAARNERMVKTIVDLYFLRRIFDHSQGHESPRESVASRLLHAARHHLQIARAIRSRDGRAAAAYMRRHVHWGREFTIDVAMRHQRFGAGGAVEQMPRLGASRLLDRLFFAREADDRPEVESAAAS